MIVQTVKQAFALDGNPPETTAASAHMGESPIYAPPKRRVRTSTSGYNFLVWISVAALVVFIVKSAFDVVGSIIGLDSPHAHLDLYRPEPSIDQVKNKRTVVQPLLGLNDTFDLAVVVWRRAVEPSHGWPWDAKTNGQDTDLKPYVDYGRSLFFPGSRTQLGHVLEASGSTWMEPVYAGIPPEFRSLNSSDKRVTTTKLKFQLPKDLLCNRYVRPNDLLGSLVVLPSEVPKLEKATRLSSYLPDSLASRFSLVPSNFQAGSAKDFHEWTVKDTILQSISVATPLLEFHTDGKEEDEGSADPDDDEFPWTQKPSPNIYEKADPYFVTRTYFTMLKETRLLDRKVYVKKQEELKNRVDDCMALLTKKATIMDWECFRFYNMNGPFETLFSFEELDPISPDRPTLTEYAYGPFLDVKDHALGPKDVKHLSFNRSSCKPPSSSTSQESLDLEWKVSFSISSPRDHFLERIFNSGSSRLTKPNADAHSVAKSQDKTELWNSFHGLEVPEDAHPRRRIAIYTLRTIVRFLSVILSLDYWYKRDTTKGISIIGTIFLIAASTISLVRDGIAAVLHDYYSTAVSIKPAWLKLADITYKLMMELPLPLLMFRTITHLRLSFPWSKTLDGSWLRKEPETHEERAAARLDERQLRGWRGRLWAIFMLAAMYYFLLPRQEHVISTMLPDPVPEHTSKAEAVLRQVCEALVDPLMLLAQVSQLVLNQRAGTWAGNHKLTAYLLLAVRVLNLLLFVPLAVGRFESRPGLSVQDVLDTMIVTVGAWQATMLPIVSQEDEDENEL